jgi:osmoprotectant transport system ATP-binding protein
MGLVGPTEGTVQVGEKNLGPENSKQLRRLRQRMGYVIQGGGLFPHMTARQNISVMARERNWNTPDINSRLNQLVEMTHFPKDGLDRYPAQLSGGQKQRVSLMRALMLDPEVLLMDEPLGALDPMIRADLRRELDGIFDRLDKTVLMVTHDLDEAVFFADEIVLMRDGEIVQTGTIQEFIEEPEKSFVSEFVSAQESQW